MSRGDGSFGARFKHEWNEFFFAPESPAGVSLFRFPMAVLLIAYACSVWPDAEAWFTNRGVVTSGTVFKHSLGWSVFRVLPNTIQVAQGVLVALIVAALGMIAGYRTRVFTVLAFVALASCHHRMPYNLSSGDTMLRVTLFFLMFSNCGHALSLDRYLALRRSGARRIGFGDLLHAPPAPGWATRLIQLQVATAYLSTVFWKLEGSTWLAGTASWYARQINVFQRLPLPGLFDNPHIVALSTWGTLVVETAMATLVWIKPARKYVLATGLLLHIGLELTMNIPTFQWVMMSTYLCFLDIRAPASRSGRSPGVLNG